MCFVHSVAVFFQCLAALELFIPLLLHVGDTDYVRDCITRDDIHQKYCG